MSKPTFTRSPSTKSDGGNDLVSKETPRELELERQLSRCDHQLEQINEMSCRSLEAAINENQVVLEHSRGHVSLREARTISEEDQEISDRAACNGARNCSVATTVAFGV